MESGGLPVPENVLIVLPACVTVRFHLIIGDAASALNLNRTCGGVGTRVVSIEVKTSVISGSLATISTRWFSRWPSSSLVFEGTSGRLRALTSMRDALIPQTLTR